MTLVTVRIVTFIPDAWIPYVDTSGIKIDFKGDGRGFNPNTANTSWFRTAHQLEVEFGSGYITYNNYKSIGETVKRTYNKVTGVTNYERDTAPISGLSLQYKGSLNHNTPQDYMSFKMICSTANPLVSGSPAIDYSFDVDVFRTGFVAIRGAHDGFPAYEIYRKKDNGSWVTIHQHHPEIGPYTYSIKNLFPPMEINVNTGS